MMLRVKHRLPLCDRYITLTMKGEDKEELERCTEVGVL